MDSKQCMQIERLWAPWRLGYVQGHESGDPAPATLK